MTEPDSKSSEVSTQRTCDGHIEFETHPSRYRHLKLSVDGAVARISLDIQEQGLRPGYVLKLNSYDLGVDIELADAVERLRFEHPEVSVVVIESGQEGVFSAGANIFMLGSASHGHKVNFCRFTNETRLGIEDATAHSGQTYVASLGGIASGGGYELALACEKIYLVDDRRSAVALPEVPYLGVLPGTGGLTRVVDKRKVRRDRADIFCALAEGLKGKKAKAWGLVDDTFASSVFASEVSARVAELAGGGHPDRQGFELLPLRPSVTDTSVTYRHVALSISPDARTAELLVKAPTELPEIGADPRSVPADWYPLLASRELDDALLRLRFNYPSVGVVTLKTRGDIVRVQQVDQALATHCADNWLVGQVVHRMKRTLKRLDTTAKSFYALADEGSCFAGTLLELALASDRFYMLDADGVQICTTAMNGGALPMGNGLSRLQTRFMNTPQAAGAAAADPALLCAAEAEERGLITVAVDDLDWEDEIRVAIEERASLSPDALTGMEANLRFVGPETMETKIFGRLSAWQNWIFQRPNAVGAKGALKLYGQPENPEFNWERT